MSARYGRAIFMAAVVVLAARGAVAHHSLAGEFDVKKVVKLQGVVSGVEWANPHIYVLLDARDAAGAVTKWRLESVPVAMMRKAGLSKNLLLADGQVANVDAFLARDGTPNLGYLARITYADGHHYQFASEN